MTPSLARFSALVLLVAAAFFAGRGIEAVDAQGRPGPTPPPPPPTGGPPEPVEQPPVLVYGEDGGSAASANGILAVTGSYGVGTSVLYVIDTTSKQLAVYEARGGSRSMRRLTLVGARRIDLDLQLEGYNDESEFSYGELRRRFDGGRSESRGIPAPTGIRGAGEGNR
jgi:hypothetical protein